MVTADVLATTVWVLQEEPQTPAFEMDPWTVFYALLTLLVAYLIARTASILLKTAAEQTVQYRITIKTFLPLVKFAIYALALYLVLGPIFQLSSSQLLAFSGLLGAAIGLGIKDLFANVVGGIVMVFERPYNTGDKVGLGDHYGEVTDIGIRTTKLVTKDDSEIAVPNYKFFTESISNANSGKAELMVVTEVYLANETDIEEAKALLRDGLRSSRYVYISDDCEIVVHVGDDPAYVTLRGKAYANDVRNEFDFESDVTDRVLSAYEQRGIDAPEVTVSESGS